LRRDKGIGFLELLACHDLRKGFEAIAVGDVAGGDRAGVPSVGRDIVERHSLATFIEIGKEGLGTRRALFGGEEGPVGGLYIVARDSGPS
jgi:hypothetical protein